MTATIVRGEWVLTMGPLGDLRDGGVLIRGGAIEAVDAYRALRDAFPDAEVVGDGAGVVLPGLINAHTHLSEALVPGMGSELTLFEWGRRIVTPVGDHLTREMARVGTQLRAIEMLRSGVTTVNDMFVHGNRGSFASLGVVDGLRSVGLRGVVSFGAEDAIEGATPLTVGDVVDEHEALAGHVGADRRIGFRYGIGTLLGQSDGLLARGVELCVANGWAVHTHLAEVREENVMASLRWGRRTIEHAEAIGLLDVPVLAGHGIWLTEDDVDRLVRHGVAVSYNPVANMILGSGVCPVQRLRRAGIAVGVGTDGAASNDSQNMLEAVKVGVLLQKVAATDPAVMSARDALAMATIEGARALGLDDRIGSLEPGKRADVVRLAGTVELATVHDPYQQVVFCAGPRSVRDAWVEGHRLLADGALVDLDEDGVIEASRPLARELAERAGLVEAGLSWLPTT
ncbi:MAG: N-ethylammeline chlorohydrolase [Actinomycetota bacterium]|jgi:cytosine/adenosine deaminase-related metal-dependent hydrolase|nr:MAG: N-ethylammeline chlorohydrolase [Actinomycetota bacterium]